MRGQRPSWEISIHALLAESDPHSRRSRKQHRPFLSTLSLRRATRKTPRNWRKPHISIHALLAESDSVSSVINNIIDNFYPRSPCGERHNINSSVNTADQISIHALLAESDRRHRGNDRRPVRFLSTLSLRRATALGVHDGWCHRYFYPRSPCGERPPYNLMIHQPKIFLSTLSLRRATSPNGGQYSV